MALTLLRYGVYWCDLSPTFGHQIAKTRPCVVISPEEMNAVVGTVLVVPITTKVRSSPFRLRITVRSEASDLLIDQARAVDKRKVKGFIAVLSEKDISRLQNLLHEVFVA